MQAIKTVLCVDDDDLSRTVLQKIVERIGWCRAIEASSGKECLDILEKETVDLLILDYFLGDTTGIEVCNTISTNALNADTPVIISSTADRDDMLPTSGCNNLVKVVQKPYRMEQLHQDLHRLLGSST